MKKIINGKRYDTETATEVAQQTWGHHGDFARKEETLYKTKNGAWFLHGKGGPATEYAVFDGNTATGGQDITPMTQEQAQEWLENNGFTDEIEQEFPENVQDA